MKRNKNELLVADMFCGAGGTSTGAERAIKELGKKMVLVCINHWPIAIETHKKNHPTARHYVEDVTTADPYKLVPEGYLDLLTASPECRFYSRARGGRPVHDQGRMNPWAVHKWLTSLNVRCLLVENVPEFVDWGPLLDDGRPDPKKKGIFFEAWFKTLWEMGYKAEWKMLNAADYGDATTRVRFFLIARKDGRNIQWPTPSHSETGERDMIEHRPKWRAAREIIEWENPGRSLFDDPKYQKRPLSDKTMWRIARGLQKFGGPLAPYYVSLLGFEPGNNGGSATLEAFVMSKQGKPTYRSTRQPVQTITTQDAPHLVEPGLKHFVMGKQGHSPAYRSVDKPLMTITCASAPKLVKLDIRPFVLGQHTCSAARDVDNPIPTVMTDGAISLINPAIIKYYGTGVPHSVDEPLGTMTTKDRFGLADPSVKPFIVPNFGERDGQRPRVHDVDDPAPTVTSHGDGNLVNPVLVEVNHDGDNRREYSIDNPLKTITNKRGTGLATGLVELAVEKVEGEIEVDPRRLVYINGELYLLDIRFRMLNNLELARAMGFTDNETTYEFVGNISEVTKQIGNAVPVNLAKALVLAIMKE